MLYPLFDDLMAKVQGGYCTRRRHPQLPLWIFNYSTKAQYDFKAHDWPQTLRDARGLVLDEQARIAARGFAKFFNLSQLPALPAGQPEFWEKVDGSLILLFAYDGRLEFSTRGSFDSLQAQFAREWFTTRFPDYRPPAGVTILLEAVYPDNRIVVDYGATQELVVLGAVDQAGADRDDALTTLPGEIRRAKFYGVRDAKSIPATEGEGFVLRWPDGTRAKVKLDEYVRVHRLIFGTSTKTVWAALRAGEDPGETTVDLPEELRQWIRATARTLRAHHAAVRADAQSFVDQARAAGLLDGPRKELAAWVKAQPAIAERELSGLVFRLADQRPVDDDIWRMVEPAFDQPAWAQREDGE